MSCHVQPVVWLCSVPETAQEASSSSNLVVETDMRVGSFRDHSKVIRGNSDTFQGIREFGHVLRCGSSHEWPIVASAQVDLL